MGLYLAVFDGDEEIEGVQVGLYADFTFFRNMVTNELEGGKVGSEFPTLELHSDCDGFWSVEETISLENELKDIRREFEKRPPVEFNSGWQKDVAKSLGIVPTRLLECFIDVDGESLLERIIGLCKISQKYQLPILFQ